MLKERQARKRAVAPLLFHFCHAGAPGIPHRHHLPVRGWIPCDMLTNWGVCGSDASTSDTQFILQVSRVAGEPSMKDV